MGNDAYPVSLLCLLPTGGCLRRRMAIWRMRLNIESYKGICRDMTDVYEQLPVLRQFLNSMTRTNILYPFRGEALEMGKHQMQWSVSRNRSVNLGCK